ncbi:hypothetical protein MHO82_24175 [Vibrio sp. Of7-15]|uniref:hypothetical protein n=1 Tax=Vibrio sp. Of7-15 TaxID=2724879 RepID=UPI001EF170F6|nr:hypothetical protein [Vibrio sp. Of7-15]MCG7499968.1 hypothetical protein [Vibrio sp. Of7-15]
MYERVQIRLNTDPKLTYWKERQGACRETYAKIVKKEPAIMEWEVDYWGRFGKWGMPFLLTFLTGFLPLLLVHHIEIKNESDEYWTTMGVVFSLFLLPLILFLLAGAWYPTRYYQKITASGFYSYGAPAGKERRQALAKNCMIGGGIIALILLLVAGPIAFVGAGAGALGFLKMGSIEEPEPEESAWPWLGVYGIILLKKPMFRGLYKIETHARSYLIVDSEQLEKVKMMVKEYGQHELDIYNSDVDRFFDRWWEHQDTMPFRQAE